MTIEIGARLMWTLIVGMAWAGIIYAGKITSKK
jgi:hypothetical protein